MGSGYIFLLFFIEFKLGLGVVILCIYYKWLRFKNREVGSLDF